MLNIEKRRHARRAFCDRIRCRVRTASSERTISCVGDDISEAGLCIYTRYGLSEGDHLDIIEPLPVPYHQATVRWTKRFPGGFQKAGLMFV